MFHSKSFEEYARTRVIPARINRARGLMQRYSDLLSRVERQFGVPRELIMAIWTMETDNGTGDMGKLPVIRTLSTLAWDCRRTELFQSELIAALKIVQRGDLPLRDLVGAYAGEIGQTQFLPSSYIKYGVDYDGDGRVDLRHSVPDVLASTANLLHTNGWQPGQPYREGTANFEAMREWNHSEIYRKTLVLFAEQFLHPDGLLTQPLVGMPFIDTLVRGFLLAAEHSQRDALMGRERSLTPRAIRRAVDVIEAEAQLPLTLSSIAARSQVSVRSLQQGFKRHLGMSPMSYLREVRLRRAHQTLIESDPSTVTVASVAFDWGFTNLGRFAAAHAARYREPPAKTLRRTA